MAQTTLSIFLALVLAVVLRDRIADLIPSCGKVKLNLIVFCLFFNPYVYELITTSFIVSLEQIALSLAILLNNDIGCVYLGVATALNPSNITLAVFLIQSKNKLKKSSIINIGAGALFGFLWLVLNELCNHITNEPITFHTIKD